MSVLDLSGKYTDEYYLDGTRIFTDDNSSSNTVQEFKKTLHRTGKPAALHNALKGAFRNCANWTNCVT